MSNFETIYMGSFFQKEPYCDLNDNPETEITVNYKRFSFRTSFKKIVSL